MPEAAWMSHWYVYVPGLSLTVHVWLPVNGTVVFLLTPGPKRWKLWIEDLSSTRIVYVPALSVFTTLPAEDLTATVKPGPEMPVSFGVAVERAFPLVAAASVT